MLTFLTFIRDYEFAGYYLLGLISLRYIYLFIAAQIQVSKTIFGLERQLYLSRRTGALGRLALIAVTVGSIYAAANIFLPQAQSAEQTRQAVIAAHQPAATQTPTPMEQFGVDVSGCTNPKATILQPKPGDAVKGKVAIRITADILNFAFYKIELGRPDEPDVWTTLFNDNTAATAAEPFAWTWDSTTVPPGVYHLRLSVLAADLTFPTPCIVPIQVLAPGP
jgi:hypothetical protein